MAKTGAVWGIDIGQCALKALRCRAHEKESNRIVVEAFDYVEYPKLLSQPDADRDALIREALETFLSRNEVQGDRIAISVPGQSGLARFIKLPPVEAKKIPDIVRYEAKQQIPFALEDVVWDYQPLEGGSQDEGYALETEVGLFAMKRDQVARAIAPLESAGVEVDVIQLAPLAVYNYACFDRMNNLEDAPPFDPEDQPPSKVLLSFGAETTDIVITNGYRVWQRNIPIGGSHFTKALTKELKLTFAKAEHLKRNAKLADDPKALFQAMRPVFSDLSAEIQRSLGFFMSNNRGAKLDEILALGNPMKLPGLQRFLTQNLEQEVHPVDSFPGLVGGSVTATPQFEENRLAFATAYGLCVQALDLSQLSTSLLPDDLIATRLIRGKKPWAVAAAALLMVGAAANYAGYYSAWQTVDVTEQWQRPLQQAQSLSRTTSGFQSDFAGLQTQFDTIKQVGENLQSNADGRLLWLELHKAIDKAIPKDTRTADERKRTPQDVSTREEIHIESMEVQHFPESTGGLQLWFTGGVQQLYEEARKSEEYQAAIEAEAAAARAAAAAEAEGPANEDAAEQGDQVADAAEDEAAPLDPEADAAAGPAAGPSGPGYVIELTGYHFHNFVPEYPETSVNRGDEGQQFVRRTLIKNLLEESVELPDGPGGQMVEVPLTKLGISYPVVVTQLRVESYKYDPEAVEGAENDGRRGGRGGFEFNLGAPGVDLEADASQQPAGEGPWELRRYDFKLQFVWQPTPRHERVDEEQGEGDPDAFDATAALPTARGDNG